MKNILVSRHAGLRAWLEAKGIKFDSVITGNAAPADVAGNCVYGILPMWLAAMTHEYWEVSMTGLPFEMRGKEYGPEQMDKWGAELVCYTVFNRPDVTKDELGQPVLKKE